MVPAFKYSFASLLYDAVATRRCIACELVIAAALFTTGSAAALADNPEWTRIFPAGGQQGQTVKVAMKTKFPNGEPAFWVDQPGLGWKATETAGEYQVTIAANAVPGVRYARAYDSIGATGLMRFVIGSLPEHNEQEPNPLPKQANPVSQLPCVINGVLGERGDVDHFGVHLQAGQTLVASIAAERELASPVDACLQLISSSGHVLLQNLDARGLDPELTWTAQSDCDVVVRVFGFPSAPDSTIALGGNENFIYRLTMASGPYVTATLPLAVSASEPTTIRPIGHNLTQAPTTISVPAVNDAFFFHIESPEFVSSLVLPVVKEPLFVASKTSDGGATATKVTIPSCISGQLREKGQEDRWEFSALKGTKLVMQLESRKLGYPLDAVLRIEDAKASVLLEVDDVDQQADPRLQWTAPEDGTYLAIVRDVNRFYGDEFVYRLTIKPESAEYHATLAKDLFRGDVGTEIEIPIKVERTGGFSDEIEFTIEGLPEAVSMALALSLKEGETSKAVVLKLTSTAPYNAPIKIIGRSKGSQDDRFQVATVEGLPIKEAWLSIQSKALTQ